MNTFNRFLVILISLTGICLSLGALVVIWAMPADLAAALRGTALLLRDNALLLQGLVTAFGVSFVLVALLVLAGEFSPQEPASVPLAGVSGGTATISLDSVNERVKTDVEQVQGVRIARPEVRRVRNAVDVKVEVRPAAEAHLPATYEEVSRVVRTTIEDRLGIRLREIRVNFLPDGGRNAARPSGDIVLPRPDQGS